MTKTLPRRCMHCRERAVSPTTVHSYPVEMEHDGRKYSFAVTDLQVLQCQNCQAIILNDSANDRIFDALRVAAGLLTPTEIRQKRNALGYNQQEPADYLNISMFTLSRWETGAQIQQRAMDKFLRVFFQSAEARSILGVHSPEPTATGHAGAALITDKV